MLVRLPKPTLDSNNIYVDSYETLHFEENVWRSDNSVSSGEKLAKDLTREAKQKIQEDFEEKQQYSEYAKTAAESMLEALIKGVNPTIENLQVKVEFYDYS